MAPEGVDSRKRPAYDPGAICVITRGPVDGEVLDFFSEVHAPQGSVPIRVEGSQPAMQRNECIRRTYQRLPNWGWILYCDADQDPDSPFALKQLLDWEVPVVSGLIYQRGVPLKLNAFVSVEEGKRLEAADCPETGLVKVQAVGTGFCLIRREVVEALGPDPWFKVGQLPPADALKEDLDFTYRASQRGFGVYVDAGLEVGHNIKCTLFPSKRDKKPWLRLPGEHEYWVPAFKGHHPGEM